MPEHPNLLTDELARVKTMAESGRHESARGANPQAVDASARGSDRRRTPEPWLTDHAALLPAGGRALDVASGDGRHALWLARRGFETLAVDRDEAALQILLNRATSARLPVEVQRRDLEIGPQTFETGAFDLIVVFHYLHRPLLPALRAALAPGGVLVYETFTRSQAARGRPTNPAFLLTRGELLTLAEPLQVLRSREGVRADGSFVASVVAQRPKDCRGGRSSDSAC